MTGPFGARGAREYEKEAVLQKRIAKDLLETLPKNLPPRVWDLGAGTGFLTRELAARLPDEGLLLAIDRSESMLSEMEDSDPRTERLAMDFDSDALLEEALPVGDPPDLVCSNLAFQWSADLPKLARALLRSNSRGLHLAFSMFTSRTFEELGDFFGKHGLPLRGLPTRLDAGEIEAIFLDAGWRRLSTASASEIQLFGDLLVTLDHVRRTGTATGTDKAFTPGVLREMLRSAPRPFPVTWEWTIQRWQSPVSI